MRPIHPCDILREGYVLPLGLSANRLARDLRVPVTRISKILNEERANRTNRYSWLSKHLFESLEQVQKYETEWLWFTQIDTLVKQSRGYIWGYKGR